MVGFQIVLVYQEGVHVPLLLLGKNGRRNLIGRIEAMADKMMLHCIWITSSGGWGNRLGRAL
jgi:hypothetical protein